MNVWRSAEPAAGSAAHSTRRSRFEALFGEVYVPLQRYARRRTDPATADDVVADTLTVLWRRLDEVPDDAVAAWCYGVARRCLANHRRGEQRRERLSARVAAEAAIETSAADTDPELDVALAELSADDREVIRLWAWEQLAPRDIAVVLGISANAAAIRVHRAKMRLGEAMTRKNEGGRGHIESGCAKEAP